MQIHELSTLGSTPASGTYLVVDTGTSTRKINYTTLAAALISNYSGTTIAGSSQTVQAAINAQYEAIGKVNNAGVHNSIYRGKLLGTSFTSAQSTAITAGTFSDLYVGDYWTINDVTWRIADFDPYYNIGDTALTTHHIAVIPDSSLYTSAWDDSGSTSNGYVNSSIRSGIQATGGALETFVSAFGNSHVLSYRARFPSAYSSGVATSSAWKDARVELLSEVEAFGSLIASAAGGLYEAGTSLHQFALFRFRGNAINIGARWWLRSVASGTSAVRMANTGFAMTDTVSTSNNGVRPFALIA